MAKRITFLSCELTVLLAFLATQVSAAGVTTRVSISSTGAQANGPSSRASISADGRYVAFASGACNLVAGDTNGFSDVFVHDRQTGVTSRVSVSSTGQQGNENSTLPSPTISAISADGRYVLFSSQAPNWGAGETIEFGGLYVHDRETGVTTRITENTSIASISSDGRFISFQSAASGLVAGDSNNVPGIFVYDFQTGLTTRVSVSITGAQANVDGSFPVVGISGNGRRVCFVSGPSYPVPGDTNKTTDISLHDRERRLTSRVSEPVGGEMCGVSADGRFMAFAAMDSNLVPGDTNDNPDIFVHERETGMTARVSVSSTGEQGNGISLSPAISADGRYVAFASGASNLVSGDTNSAYDVFVHDRQTGQTNRLSVSSAGEQANDRSDGPSISADGRFVAFGSGASNLVPGDTNGWGDIFVHDLLGNAEGSSAHQEVQPAGLRSSEPPSVLPRPHNPCRSADLGESFPCEEGSPAQPPVPPSQGPTSAAPIVECCPTPGSVVPSPATGLPATGLPPPGPPRLPCQ